MNRSGALQKHFWFLF